MLEAVLDCIWAEIEELSSEERVCEVYLKKGVNYVENFTGYESS